LRSKKSRIASSFVLLIGTLALTGLVAPGASAENGSFIVEFVEGRGPTSAQVDTPITSVEFDEDGAPVQVEVSWYGESAPDGTEVTLNFAEGSTTDGLSGNVASTVGGIATFPELAIDTANEPLSTDYLLEPSASPPSEGESVGIASVVTGAASAPFDIWDAACRDSAGCTLEFQAFAGGEGGGEVSIASESGGVLLREETYTADPNIGLGASELDADAITFSCPTQFVIYDEDLFFHATPAANDRVFLVTHITRAAMKSATNNGQNHVGWCVGLKNTPGPWNFTQQNTNGTPGIQSDDLYVGLAQKCPKKQARMFAPCFLSKSGDDNGGSIIRGWLPGGDPPRRT
jgi:hypothetical protein